MATATLSELEQLLIAADEAGNVEDANAIASEIRRIRGLAAGSGFEAGIMDPINAGAQMLERALPEPVVQSITQLNNWLASKGVPLASVPPGGVDQMIREGEAAYQQTRQGVDEGVDWDRLAGNILNPVNIAAASRIPQAATLPGRVAAGTAAGAGFGALQPVTQGDFAEEKKKQTAIGAVSGGALPMVTGAAARMIRPQTSPDVSRLIAEGVTPTPGQIAGGALNRVEEKMMSMPIVGDAIASARTQSIEGLNRAAFNRALAPIGKAFPKTADVGRGGVDYVRRQLSSAYDDLLPKLRGELDTQLRADIANLQQMAQTFTPARRRQFENILQQDVFRRFTNSGLASGTTIKEIEAKLGGIVRNYIGSQDGDQRALGQAVREVQSSIRSMLERVNPAQRGKLQPINKGYANFKILEDAASRRGSKEGVFTPAALAGASRSADKSAGKGRTARGQALMQDLTDAGENVLSAKVPNSGTFDRLALNALAGYGAYAVDPTLLATMGALSVPYLPGARNVVAQALTARPPQAEAIANAVRGLNPYLIPGAVSGTYGLLGQ